MAVYLIKDRFGNLKIGVASDVKKRFKNLRTGNPHDLYLVDSFNTRNRDFTCETRIHNEIKHCRIDDRLEWFSINKRKDSRLVVNILCEYDSKLRRDRGRQRNLIRILQRSYLDELRWFLLKYIYSRFFTLTILVIFIVFFINFVKFTSLF
jgi:hypothetical protein